MNNDNRSEAKNYLNSLSEKFQISSKEFCKNSIVNAVLNTKYKLAVQYNIDCFFHIDLDKAVAIAALDLCSILSNTLDNAIEAAIKITDPTKRKITLKARCDKGYLSYHIVNSTNDEKQQSYSTEGIYTTDKPNKNLHGYGLEIIKGIVEKYNGIIKIKHANKELSVLIVIKVE
jgi:two-component system sensor histidine kinase AgrC